jgi:microsomal epoxide hydrolase
MIYWTTGTIASSQRFYKECFMHPKFDEFNRCVCGSGYVRAHSSAPVLVPSGYACFPNDLGLAPRAFITYKYPNMTHYTDMPRGGHFAAMEEPKLLAHDVFKFVRSLP